MCVADGNAEYDPEDVAAQLGVKRYKCNDCGNSFQGIGKNVICPSCRSKNVVTK